MPGRDGIQGRVNLPKEAELNSDRAFIVHRNLSENSQTSIKRMELRQIFWNDSNIDSLAQDFSFVILSSVHSEIHMKKILQWVRYSVN